MNRTRRAVMVVFVASALCADRVATAAPALRPEVVSVARRITSRLVGSFRHAVPAARLRETRSPRPVLLARVAPPPAAPRPPAVQISPFQFRLPPPAL